MLRRSTSLDNDLTALYRATRKLRPEQGRIARQNARSAALKALARFRRRMDRDFPVIHLQNVARRKPAPVEHRVRKLLENGWVQVTPSIAGLYAPLGVKAKRLARALYLPGWILLVDRWGGRGALARALKTKSKRQRDAIIATAALRKAEDAAPDPGVR